MVPLLKEILKKMIKFVKHPLQLHSFRYGFVFLLYFLGDLMANKKVEVFKDLITSVCEYYEETGYSNIDFIRL